MGTLPTTGENLDLIGFELEEQPSYTHKLDIEGQRVAGMTTSGRPCAKRSISSSMWSATPTPSIPAIMAPSWLT